MKRLKLVLPHTRKQLIMSGLAAVVVVGGVSTGVYAYTRQSEPSTPVSNVIEKSQVKETPAVTDQPKDIEKVDTPAPQTAAPTTQQADPTPTSNAPVTDNQAAAADDAYLNKLCDGVTRYLANLQGSNAYKLGVMQHPVNGNTTVQMWYQQYNQCVDAGKIQPL